MSHKAFVTIDGVTLPTTSEVVVRVYNDAINPESDDTGLHFKFTHEGVITDLVESGEVIEISAEMYSDLAGGLLDDSTLDLKA